jgi:hypothetical protein
MNSLKLGLKKVRAPLLLPIYLHHLCSTSVTQMTTQQTMTRHNRAHMNYESMWQDFDTVCWWWHQWNMASHGTWQGHWSSSGLEICVAVILQMDVLRAVTLCSLVRWIQTLWMHLFPQFLGYLNPLDGGSSNVLQKMFKQYRVLHHINL